MGRKSCEVYEEIIETRNMKRLIIADVKSTNVNGKSSGHYFSLAQNYIDLYESEFEVKVAGGPVYQTAFDEVRLFRLPYDSTEHLSAAASSVSLPTPWERITRGFPAASSTLAAI